MYLFVFLFEQMQHQPQGRASAYARQLCKFGNGSFQQPRRILFRDHVVSFILRQRYVNSVEKAIFACKKSGVYEDQDRRI